MWQRIQTRRYEMVTGNLVHRCTLYYHVTMTQKQRKLSEAAEVESSSKTMRKLAFVNYYIKYIQKWLSLYHLLWRRSILFNILTCFLLAAKFTASFSFVTIFLLVVVCSLVFSCILKRHHHHCRLYMHTRTFTKENT